MSVVFIVLLYLQQLFSFAYELDSNAHFIFVNFVFYSTVDQEYILYVLVHFFDASSHFLSSFFFLQLILFTSFDIKIS